MLWRRRSREVALILQLADHLRYLTSRRSPLDRYWQYGARIATLRDALSPHQIRHLFLSFEKSNYSKTALGLGKVASAARTTRPSSSTPSLYLRASPTAPAAISKLQDEPVLADQVEEGMLTVHPLDDCKAGDVRRSARLNDCYSWLILTPASYLA